MMTIHFKVPALAAAATLFMQSFCSAQDAATLETAKKYPDAHGVVWSHTESLRLRFEKGALTARSDVSRETLLLSDHATSLYNTDEVYHGFMHELDGVEAATLIPDGDRYKTIKATEYRTTHSEEENIFYTDSKRTQISYSNLARYARTKLDYSIIHSDVHYLSPFYFQSYMPVRSAVYTVTAPKSVNLGYRLVGLHTDRIRFSKEEGRNEVTYTWSAADVPRAVHFDDAPSNAHSIPHVLVYVKGYKAPHVDTNTAVLASVSDLYHYYYPFVRDVNSGTDEAMNATIAELTKGKASPRDQAAAIYKWVQEHMRYVAYEDSFGGYIPRAAAMVCSRRFGDCKDMTSLLVAMCRRAGLDAHFAWIGTRDIPYRYEDAPLPIADNHMICAVKLDGQWVLMDGTDRVIPFGTPPSPLQEKEALIAIDANTFKVFNVPVAPPDQNMVADTTTLRLSGTDLEGDVASHYSGYGAWRIAATMQYSSEAERDKVLRRMSSRGSDKYIQTATHFIPSGNEAKDCAITAVFRLPDYARKAGDETYVNLNLQRSYDDDYVDKAIREVPIEYSYRQHLRQVVSLKLPPGYKATYLPPDKADSEPGLWGYKLHYEQKGGEVWLVKDFVLHTLNITPEQFTAHNRLIEGLRSQYKESVVLSNK